uniref:60S acidic ribosomal protein P2 n=1 Tax=Chaetoceros debilis TaxID=122233 RepID=A0A7S3V8S4_9STRA|mmetsp:Transcript_20660/g.31371  ORF Transcript_20660/g.31371 Transcript_20660/m.31371 type:complete len:118 (+) Transcript_20660:39-392(+)|eukprot:CAMPEP_0194079284 /NCGR_PEP_ID=MMETSP0149-20130528/5499_1 /TAXON_ID=122233 /ORGANISM="Chaetoceros debilis, Strain MM31A-1" /LENGTH=117 /DNA_ID=CAMNT_0038760723 /DNA_START=622 /DNA_END=975 /DNA_ORIENTATION=+
MSISSLSDLSDSQKQELVASLASIVVGDSSSSEALSAVAEASGNSLDGSMAALFSSVVASAGGLKKFCAAPGAGGGGGGGVAVAGGEEAAVEEEPEEEEEAPAATDMFGGDGDGGDY